MRFSWPPSPQNCPHLPPSLFVCLLYRVSQKMSHSWDREPKKFGTSYSETKHLLDLKLWQRRTFMSTRSQHFRPNRLVVSKCEIIFGTPCICGTPESTLPLNPSQSSHSPSKNQQTLLVPSCCKKRFPKISRLFKAKTH